MRKVIGVGETILDIIFQGNQPRKAVPGGSTFNCMISLGRCKIPALFISELGDDRLGNFICEFMVENNLSPDYIDLIKGCNSPISLAFLDQQRNAEYIFYRNFPKERSQIKLPEINKNDIVIISSYYAVNPDLRRNVSLLVTEAKKQGAIVYYDINFRKTHASQRLKLMPYFIENFGCATIVRCSDEDLETLFPGKTIDTVYREEIVPYCENFIVTKGDKGIVLKTEELEKEYPVEVFSPVSTIGAGDNFNAGLIYGIINYNYTNINHLKEEEWDKLIDLAKAFATEICGSYDNYVSIEFAQMQPEIYL